MVKRFMALDLPKQLFFVLLFVIFVVFIKEILLIAALGLLVWVVADIVWEDEDDAAALTEENFPGHALDTDQTL